MNRAQKIALFNLIVLTIGLALALVLVIAEIFEQLAGFVVVGTGIVVVISGLFFRKKAGKVDFDERDYLIRERAWFVAVASSYGCFGGNGIYQYFKVGPDGLVPMGTLLGMFISALITLVFMKSFATLLLYAKGFKHGKW